MKWPGMIAIVAQRGKFSFARGATEIMQVRIDSIEAERTCDLFSTIDATLNVLVRSSPAKNRIEAPVF